MSTAKPSGWSPPPDTCKPPLPYQAGLVLQVRRHTAAPPYGPGTLNSGLRRQLTESEIRRLKWTQTQYCLRTPTVQLDQPASPEVHPLDIVRQIACSDGRGAQIVLCKFGDGLPQQPLMVAKIFDPIYYAYSVKGRPPVDVTYRADMHYCREVAAYEMLCSQGVDGVYAPKYHGSWTFDLAAKTDKSGEATARFVCLVLMEELRGIKMDSLALDDQLTTSERLDMLGQALELDAKILQHGVKHGNLSPRHVMLLVDFENKTASRRLVDFSSSVTDGRRVDIKQDTSLRQSQCRSPLELYGNAIDERPETCMPRKFDAWLPADFASRPELFRDWARARWTSCDLFGPAQVQKEREQDKAYFGLIIRSSLYLPSLSTSLVPDVIPPSKAASTTKSAYIAALNAYPTSAYISALNSAPTTTSAYTSALSTTATRATSCTPTSSVRSSPLPTQQTTTAQALFPLNAGDFTTCLEYFRDMDQEALEEADYQLALDNTKMQMCTTALQQSAENYDTSSAPADVQRAVASVVSTVTGDAGLDEYLKRYAKISKEALPEAGAQLALENAMLQMRIAALSMVQAERLVAALPLEAQRRRAGFRKGTDLEMKSDQSKGSIKP